MGSWPRRLAIVACLMGTGVAAPARAADVSRFQNVRIDPSCAMITITSGHGDCRARHELPRRIGGPPPLTGALNASQWGDSPDEGALADLLLVGGDPLQDLTLIETPERSFVPIMKAGVIHKNPLPR